MIGRMDQRITFQRATATPDGIGGLTQAWEAIAINATVWAQVTPKPMKAREEMIEGRMTATQVTWLRIYSRTDLTEQDRVLWNGRVFNIRSVVLDSTRSQFMDLICEAGITQ